MRWRSLSHVSLNFFIYAFHLIMILRQTNADLIHTDFRGQTYASFPSLLQKKYRLLSFLSPLKWIVSLWSLNWKILEFTCPESTLLHCEIHSRRSQDKSNSQPALLAARHVLHNDFRGRQAPFWDWRMRQSFPTFPAVRKILSFSCSCEFVLCAQPFHSRRYLLTSIQIEKLQTMWTLEFADRTLLRS